MTDGISVFSPWCWWGWNVIFWILSVMNLDKNVWQISKFNCASLESRGSWEVWSVSKPFNWNLRAGTHYNEIKSMFHICSYSSVTIGICSNTFECISSIHYFLQQIYLTHKVSCSFLSFRPIFKFKQQNISFKF